MAAPVDLKATINLPKTAFPMKANLPQNEPKLLARWEGMGLYQLIRQARKGAPIYVMHDGPPYANDVIHLGTALNKTVKDLVVKSKTMAGFDAPYVPGWDCHGLPIEIKVDRQLGAKKRGMAPIEVRRACRTHAEKYVDIQRKQFKRIGTFGQWDDPYLTMSPQYEAWVLRTLYEIFEKGLVYKGLRPVYWCIHDRTALAEAEVEYEPHTSPSIWVKYALTSDPAKIDPALAGKKVSTIIWTTTPWTLPASMAVAFHPELEYVALESGGEHYIVASHLALATIENCKLAGARPVASFPGTRLEQSTFAHPFLQRSILGVLATYVTTDQGTGAVHTAPSHGADDFYTGLKYKLDATCNVDAAGRLHNGLPEYEGLTVFKANEPIIELIKSRGVLMARGDIEHSYPHCWRCHNPVIFRATEQWFISMDAPLDGSSLRQRSLEEIKTVKWDPAWGEERITNMVAERPDWCISRQRVWGVPIAFFSCEACGQIVHSREVNQAVVRLVEREGVDAWYTRQPAEILPANTRCAKCGKGDFRKEMDIIDVWFESGCSHAAVLGHQPDLPWPADLYAEGGDQYRGWFHSSLLCAVGSRGKAPYRVVSTIGWTLDPQGRAMSKSLGNTVDPAEVSDKLGAEIVRFWVSSVDFREDVRNSDEMMQRLAELYRKIRNTFRFILGNLDGFDPARNSVPFMRMEAIDRYMLLRTSDFSRDLQKWYESFEFHKVYQAAVNFCITDLSAVYFDVLKDRLYTFAPDQPARRSAQTAIWRIGEALVRLLAPILSFTCEEVWGFLPAVQDRGPSVHLALFPKAEEIADGDDARLRADWITLLAVRSEVLKALEAARNEKQIGSGLEAAVRVFAPEATYPVLDKYARELRYLFIVSEVALERVPGGNGAAGIKVEVRPAPGAKCERCWNYSTQVGADPEHPTICERCTAALKEIVSGH
ncbi:MAG TPA: isoleucine--tRNA ligase [Terriglobales bacterium]|nr:isoleucine--tRNA ligase [Terriglobales bacterium]